MKGLLELLKLNEINCAYLLNVSRLVVSRNSVFNAQHWSKYILWGQPLVYSFMVFLDVPANIVMFFLIGKNVCMVIIALI